MEGRGCLGRAGGGKCVCVEGRRRVRGGSGCGVLFREALPGEDQSQMLYTWEGAMQAAGQAELQYIRYVRTRKEL